MSEQWKTTSFGTYESSSLGRIRNAATGRVLRQWGTIYKMVGVTIGGKKYSILVHKLVADGFLGPRPEGLTINHEDGNKENNKPKNLTYMTQSANQLHAKRLGIGAVGEKVTAFVKLTRSEVVEIRKQYSTGKFTQQAVAEKYGVTRSAISYIVNGKAWRHVG